MLARSYLSAAELQTTEERRTALITLLGMMERGEIPEEKFDMARWCGTPCCIYGHARYINAKAFPFHVTISHDVVMSCKKELGSSLMRLFTGFELVRGAGVQHIGVAQAAQALSNYLTTGDPCWAEVQSAALVRRAAFYQP